MKTHASSFGAGLFGISLQYSVMRRSVSSAWRISEAVSLVRRLYGFPHMVTVTFSLSISFSLSDPHWSIMISPEPGRKYTIILIYIIQYTPTYCKPFLKNNSSIFTHGRITEK